MNKKIISLGLVSVLSIGTVACAASPNDKEVINEVTDEKEVISETVDDESVYIIHSGRISEVFEDGDDFSIVVDEREMLNEGGEPSRGAINFNITKDSVVVNEKTEESVDQDKLVEGTVVEVSYRKDQPMTNSLPPMTNAVEVTVLSEANEVEGSEIKSLDKIIYKGEEINLKDEIYKSEDVFMIPMREVGENLGYETSWNSKANQAELTKGTNMVTASLDEDMYSFSKMIVKLGKSSEVKDGVTFVPVSFLREVMQLDVEINKNGVINIK